MSNYFARTRFCPTGEIADAEWLDGYFGRRVYGVRFPDGEIHHESQCEVVPSGNTFWSDRVCQVEDGDGQA